MQRREFIGLLGGAAAVWPIVARAQQGERVRRIGVLMGFVESDPQWRAWLATFQAALRELGWTDGRQMKRRHSCEPRAVIALVYRRGAAQALGTLLVLQPLWSSRLFIA